MIENICESKITKLKTNQKDLLSPGKERFQQDDDRRVFISKIKEFLDSNIKFEADLNVVK